MGDEQRLKIFISYSRRDIDFADRLVAALDAHGFDVTIDRRNLPKLEDWERELVGLIRAADTVVFIVSPASAASPVCTWEVGQVRSYSKRLAPVVIADVDAAAVPAEISRINYIFFTGNAPFDERVDELAHALNTDVEWLKEHTRLGELAQRWSERGRPEEELIRAKDLEEASAWAARRPREAPVVSEVLLEFLAASRTGEVERLKREQEQVARTARIQRRAAWSLAAVAALIALGLIAAAVQTRSASEQQARVLTSVADTEMQRGYFDRAMRMALQGLPPAGTVPWLKPASRDLEAKLSGAAMASRLKAQMSGHTDKINSAEFSPHGKHTLSASADGTARVWSVEGGDPPAIILAGHTGPVESAVYSPDGSRIVTASDDKTARLWDAATGKPIGTPLVGHSDVVNRAAFSPDGARILTYSFDHTARLWDASTGAPIAVLEGHQDIVANAVFSPDGSRIATASLDGTVGFWDGRRGTKIRLVLKTEGSMGHVQDVAFNADGSRLLVISDVQSVGTHEAQLWNGQTGEVIKVFDAIVNSAVFSADGTRLVTTSGDNEVLLIDARSGETLATLTGHTSSVDSAAFSPDGALIVTGSLDRTARLWDGKTGKPVGEPLRGHQGKVSVARFGPDGARVLTASDDNTARLWNVQRGNEIATLRGHEGEAIIDAKFSRDGALALTVGDDKTIRVWDARIGDEVAVIKTENSLLVAISPKGTRALVRSVSGSTAAPLLDSQTGAQIAVLKDPGSFDDVAFSPDGSRLAIAFNNNTVRLYDTGNGAAIASYKGRGNPQVAFNRDGVLMLAGSDGKKIMAWEADSGADLLTASAIGLERSLFSPDGARLLGWSVLDARAGTGARLWDISSRMQIATLPFAGGYIQSAVFSADGERLLTITHDNKARIWDGRKGTSISVLDGEVNSFDDAVFSPDATRILTWSQGVDSAPAPLLWDVASGKPIGSPLRGHHDRLRGASFSPDGTRILTASDDKTARLWDGQNGTPIALLGHDGEVNAAAFKSPDGALIASSSEDTTVRLWDGHSGTAIVTLKGHEQGVWDAEFSNDGTRLMTISHDDTLRIWNIAALTQDHGLQLREHVCSAKLIGAGAFTVEDVRNPILQGLAGSRPCALRGPLSPDFWSGIGRQAWSFAGRLF
jgi:WD40 repeat protein